MKSRITLLLMIFAVVSLGLAPYAIATEFLTVLDPNGGEQLQAGEWYTLRWTDDNPELPDSVEVYVVVPDPFGYVLGPLTVPNDKNGEYRWFIPEDTDEPSCMFGVSYLDRSDHDESNGTFSIVAQ
jgi:hypothetical protein